MHSCRTLSSNILHSSLFYLWPQRNRPGETTALEPDLTFPWFYSVAYMTLTKQDSSFSFILLLKVFQMSPFMFPKFLKWKYSTKVYRFALIYLCVYTWCYLWNEYIHFSHFSSHFLAFFFFLCLCLCCSDINEKNVFYWIGSYLSYSYCKHHILDHYTSLKLKLFFT